MIPDLPQQVSEMYGILHHNLWVVTKCNIVSLGTNRLYLLPADRIGWRLLVAMTEPSNGPWVISGILNTWPVSTPVNLEGETLYKAIQGLHTEIREIWEKGEKT